jgi:hypothetical protein
MGQRFQTVSRATMRKLSTPISGDSPEAIWHQLYDTQDYTSAATTTLTFFANPNADRTLTNMDTGGQLTDPQYLSVYDVTCDFLTQNTSDAASVAGELNDLSLLLLVGRPTWTLTLSDKNYGPYNLTGLHGTGGPVGGISVGTNAVAAQWANNALGPGWNYKGSIIIPPKTSFRVTVNWAAAQTLNATPCKIRLSLFGILSRAVK